MIDNMCCDMNMSTFSVTQSMTSIRGECKEGKSSLAQYQVHTALSKLSWHRQSLQKQVLHALVHFGDASSILAEQCATGTEQDMTCILTCKARHSRVQSDAQHSVAVSLIFLTTAAVSFTINCSRMWLFPLTTSSLGCLLYVLGEDNKHVQQSSPTMTLSRGTAPSLSIYCERDSCICQENRTEAWQVGCGAQQPTQQALQGKASTSYVKESAAGSHAIADPQCFCYTDVVSCFWSLPFTTSNMDTCTSGAALLMSGSHACQFLPNSVAAIHIEFHMGRVHCMN